MTYEETMYQKLVVDDATNEATLDDLCPNSGASMGVCGCVMCEELINENKLIKHDLTSILTDLITELRNHPAGEYCCCGWCDRDRERADRAEARLREVQGE